MLRRPEWAILLAPKGPPGLPNLALMFEFSSSPRHSPTRTQLSIQRNFRSSRVMDSSIDTTSPTKINLLGKWDKKMTDDVELDAMRTVLASLNPLEPDARARVIFWITRRLEVEGFDLVRPISSGGNLGRI